VMANHCLFQEHGTHNCPETRATASFELLNVKTAETENRSYFVLIKADFLLIFVVSTRLSIIIWQHKFVSSRSVWILSIRLSLQITNRCVLGTFPTAL
jgi:hypothetical protein